MLLTKRIVASRDENAQTYTKPHLFSQCLTPFCYCMCLRYKDGMLKARFGDDLETEQVVQSVAEGMLTITETRGQDAVEDWEVDELLEWTNGLNFDQYVD